MAAVLPAMQKTTKGVSEREPSPPGSATPQSRSAGGRGPRIRGVSRKEAEIIVRREELRAAQPRLTKAETASYRHTYKHNLCLDMLQDGFHRSFSELFSLIKRQKEARLAAGPDSVLWNAPLLENERDKLDVLQRHLTDAERALRDEDLPAVYAERLKLARHFQRTTGGDKWLSDHFFATSLEVGELVADDDGGEKMAEAHCNLGLAMEQNGDFITAADHFEEYYRLATKGPGGGGGWRNEAGVPCITDACNHLARVYAEISDSLPPDEKKTKVQFLIKAYNYAKEAGDDKTAGDAAYRLGVAYHKTGDSKTALLYLKAYLELCEKAGDDVGIGKACEAIAKAYDSEGDTDESIAYLLRFVDVAERSRQDSALASACRNLGYVFNARGDYQRAASYFQRAFGISQAANDRPATESARVHAGIAQAHSVMAYLPRHLHRASDKAAMQRLIAWKNARVDSFSKPLPGKGEEAGGTGSE